MKKILVLDPGESTGWVVRYNDGQMAGGTLPKNHLEVHNLIMSTQPDIIVFERFNLYPGMAKHLIWDSFYPCEVIGVIKMCALLLRVECLAQAPADKKFAGGFDDDWLHITSKCRTTEHTKDAYLHLKYYLRNKGKRAD